MLGLTELYRRGAATDGVAHFLHYRRAENGIGHATYHGRHSGPLSAPLLPGLARDGGPFSVRIVGHEIGKAAHAALVGGVWERRVVGSSFRR